MQPVSRKLVAITSFVVKGRDVNKVFIHMDRVLIYGAYLAVTSPPPGLASKPVIPISKEWLAKSRSSSLMLYRSTKYNYIRMDKYI